MWRHRGVWRHVRHDTHRHPAAFIYFPATSYMIDWYYTWRENIRNKEQIGTKRRSDCLLLTEGEGVKSTRIFFRTPAPNNELSLTWSSKRWGNLRQLWTIVNPTHWLVFYHGQRSLSLSLPFSFNVSLSTGAELQHPARHRRSFVEEWWTVELNVYRMMMLFSIKQMNRNKLETIQNMIKIMYTWCSSSNAIYTEVG